jgi:hypothetical protein
MPTLRLPSPDTMPGYGTPPSSSSLRQRDGSFIQSPSSASSTPLPIPLCRPTDGSDPPRAILEIIQVYYDAGRLTDIEGLIRWIQSTFMEVENAGESSPPIDQAVHDPLHVY